MWPLCYRRLSAFGGHASVVVPDVEQFPGHIACSALSRSEIVVPIFEGNKVIAVLDIDSTDLAAFDETDRLWLEKVVRYV